MTSNAENEKRGELAGRADGRCWAEHTTEHDDLRRVAAIEFQPGLDCYKGTSNNTRFQRFLSWLSGRLQRSCRGESPIGDRFDAWPASVLCTMPHGLHP